MSDKKGYPVRVFLTVATDDGLELWSTTRRNPNSIEYRHISQVERLNDLVAMQKRDMKNAMDDNERLRAIATTVATFDCDCIEMPTIQIYEPCLRCRAKAALKEGDDV